MYILNGERKEYQHRINQLALAVNDRDYQRSEAAISQLESIALAGYEQARQRRTRQRKNLTENSSLSDSSSAFLKSLGFV